MSLCGDGCSVSGSLYMNMSVVKDRPACDVAWVNKVTGCQSQSDFERTCVKKNQVRVRLWLTDLNVGHCLRHTFSSFVRGGRA
jgi:hypothetical protein